MEQAIVIKNPDPQLMQMIMLKAALKLYVATNCKVIPTRGMTRNKMLGLAEKLTGEAFPRSLKGVTSAIKTLEKEIEA